MGSREVVDALRRQGREALRARGLELVRIDWDTALPAVHLPRLLARYDVRCVLDVGARQGEYGSWLRELGYRGRIVSFEPAPTNLPALRRRAADDPAWDVHPYALGAAPETKRLHVTAATHFSSFRDARLDVVADDAAKRTVVDEPQVEIRRLDDVWSAVVGPAAGAVFLKSDTQGWDLEVLRGATRVLPDVVGLQVEVSNRPIYAGMPDLLESLAAVRAAGFTISALYPLNSGPGFTPIEFDCVAVRPEAG